MMLLFTEVAGMLLSLNRDTTVFDLRESFSNGTVLFKGDHLRVLEEGVLMAWVYLFDQEREVHLQVWRPTGHVAEYRLVYSKLVNDAPGIHFLNVTAEHFNVSHDDLIGISFPETSPIPLFRTDDCVYYNVEGLMLVRDRVFFRMLQVTQLDTVTMFYDDDFCVDYFVQAVVRYYGK